MPDVEMMIPVDGSQLWVHDSQDELEDQPAGHGDAIVLLHPGWGDSRIWDPLLAILPFGLRIVRYDTRGYGRSPAPTARFSQLGDLLAVLDQRQIARALVVGHSGGGATAISLAIEHQDRVSALVLLAPGVWDYPWPEDDPFGAEFVAAFSAGDAGALEALGLRTWAAASADEAAQAQIRSAVTAYFQLGHFEQPDPPAFARLAEIKAPTVVVLGDLEYKMVADCGHAVVERIPGCEFVGAPGSDHLLPLRKPELIAELVASRLH